MPATPSSMPAGPDMPWVAAIRPAVMMPMGGTGTSVQPCPDGPPALPRSSFGDDSALGMSEEAPVGGPLTRAFSSWSYGVQCAGRCVFGEVTCGQPGPVEHPPRRGLGGVRPRGGRLALPVRTFRPGKALCRRVIVQSVATGHKRCLGRLARHGESALKGAEPSGWRVPRRFRRLWHGSPQRRRQQPGQPARRSGTSLLARVQPAEGNCDGYGAGNTRAFSICR